MTPKKITKGCRVLIDGVEGWWVVEKIEGTGLTLTRKNGKQEKSTWSNTSEVVAVSNKRTKGKRK